MHKVLSTLLTVLVAVGASALIWVAANMVFNQVRHQWRRFTAMAFAAVGFLVGVLLSGNRITKNSQGGFLSWVWLPLLLAVIFAAIGVVLESTSDTRRRQGVGVSSGVLLGVGVGLLVRKQYQIGRAHV